MIAQIDVQGSQLLYIVGQVWASLAHAMTYKIRNISYVDYRHIRVMNICTTQELSQAESTLTLH